MLEILLCSMLTILPDYLYRRYRQGKRIGKEITLFSVWYELRWGIVSCLLLTIGLITVIFYFHPATSNVTSVYRTVPIVSETNGRVAEIFVTGSSEVKRGQPIFRLDSSKQEAAVDTATKQAAEVDAALVVAKADLAAAEGQILQARANLQQALDEQATKQELFNRNPDTVTRRELERLQNAVNERRGMLTATEAGRDAVAAKLTTLLPAQKASAEAALAQARVDLDKTVIRAGVNGRVEQFALQVGDIVNPFARPAGVLIPDGQGRRRLFAGFGQTESGNLKVGMVAEATCLSKPWTVIPLVVTGVQDYIAAGQFRGGEQLVDVQQLARPGTVLVTLEPLFDGGLDDVTPGSVCLANAYSNHHDEIASPGTGTLRAMALHGVDAVGVVHAMLLRIQALIMPVQQLIFSGGH